MQNWRWCKQLALVGSMLCITSGAFGQAGHNVIRFSGYDWEIRGNGVGGPGPNHWDPRNVWVDAETGWLHLRIAHSGGEWSCAEVSTAQSFGLGTYEFAVTGRIDRFDPKIVLGLFDYPAPGQGGDGTNEIDIEIARWGNPKWPNGNFTVWPAIKPTAGSGQSSKTFEFALKDEQTIHRFTRRKESVELVSAVVDRASAEAPISSWTFKPEDYLHQVPQEPLPVHINLWLFKGKPPADGRDVEVVIKRFVFTP